MIDVTLTDYEMAMASDAGRLRNIAAVKRGYESRIVGREWQAHIEGACGEVAVVIEEFRVKGWEVGGCEVE